jgi:hypothetical protein
VNRKAEKNREAAKVTNERYIVTSKSIDWNNSGEKGCIPKNGKNMVFMLCYCLL